MVEVISQQLKISVEKFLEDAKGGELDFDPPDLMISQHRKFLDFLNGKWVEGAAARAQTRSVEEGLEQQINLVGSRAIYDRVSHDLARLDNTSDPFFVKEQLLLFKWRVHFISNFFPIEAATEQYLQGIMWRPDHSPGWWRCFGAHGLPGGSGRSDFYPEFALAGMAFDWVLDKAFNNPEGYVVNFDKAWDTVPAVMKKQGSFLATNFAAVGVDYEYKYWLFCSDPEEEEHVFKLVHTVDEDNIKEGEGMPLSYLKLVVYALHSQGPPSLTELAIKRVLELELPVNKLPKEIKAMIASGPAARPLTDRGSHLLEVLELKDDADTAEMEQQEKDELEEKLAVKIQKDEEVLTTDDESTTDDEEFTTDVDNEDEDGDV